MEAVIESIVDKLRYLAKPQLEFVLNFVNFLTWKSTSGLLSTVSDSDAEIGDREAPETGFLTTIVDCSPEIR